MPCPYDRQTGETSCFALVRERRVLGRKIVKYGVRKSMVDLVRRSITPAAGEDAFTPILEMGGYYVSRIKQESTDYSYMFPIEVDGTELHVYIRL